MTIKSKYAIIKEKEKENMKKQLENVVSELQKLIDENAEIINTIMAKIEIRDENNLPENETLNYELQQNEKTQKKLYEALIIIQKLLKRLG